MPDKGKRLAFKVVQNKNSVNNSMSDTGTPPLHEKHSSRPRHYHITHFFFVIFVLFCCHVKLILNPFTPRVSYGDIKVILTSESVDEILSCDHPNEILSSVLSHGTILVFNYLAK